MDKALVLEGVSEWQIGYFMAEFDHKFKGVKYDIMSTSEDKTKIALRIPKLSTLAEFRLLRLIHSNEMTYYFGTLKA